jgi:hypothetical protein
MPWETLSLEKCEAYEIILTVLTVLIVLMFPPGNEEAGGGGGALRAYTHGPR